MPELVASLCTLLVLAPLALMPGLGEFLYRPMAAGVAFAMISAYVLSRSFVPSRSARWLKPHAATRIIMRPAMEAMSHDRPRRPVRRRAGRPKTAARHVAGCFAAPSRAGKPLIEAAIGWYVRQLDRAMNHRLPWSSWARSGCWRSMLVVLGPRLRREFFPEVDSGAFEIYARPPSGTRIEETEKTIARVEQFVREQVGDDLQLIISELGVVADLSAAYTPNAGPMDAVVKVQLKHEREHSAQEYVHKLRTGLTGDPELPRPGVRLRCRRHDPLGDERGEIVADQHPPLRQEHEAGPRRSPSRSSARSPGSTAWSTPGSSSGSIIPSTSSRSIAPRWPTWGSTRPR